MTADLRPRRRRLPAVPLRLRITLAAAVVVTALLWGGGLLLLRDSRAALHRSLDAQVTGIAREVAGQLQSGAAPSSIMLRPGDGPFADPAVQVRSTEGELLAQIAEGLILEFRRLAPRLGDGGLAFGDAEPAVPLDPRPPSRPPDPAPPLQRLATTDSWSVVAVHVAREGTDYVVYAGSPYAVVEPVLQPLEERLRVAVPLAGFVAALLSYVLGGRALRPVERIRAEAEAVTETSLARRVPEPATNDEIGKLARTFNRMLGRLEAAQTRQRQFISDASHELRSPVTIMRSTLEIASAHPTTTDWQATAADLLAATDRMERLVDDLLLLARRDEAPTSAAEEVDLDQIVLEETQLRPLAPISLGQIVPSRLLGSRRDLGHAVANLLDNAVWWCTSSVRISLRHEGAIAVLRVEDDGPGIPAEDRQTVFERFVRLDDSRQRTSGGAGLGLAVVSEAVRAHGGTVAVFDSDMKGAAFVVTLPLCRT